MIWCSNDCLFGIFGTHEQMQDRFARCVCFFFFFCFSPLTALFVLFHHIILNLSVRACLCVACCVQRQLGSSGGGHDNDDACGGGTCLIYGAREHMCTNHNLARIIFRVAHRFDMKVFFFRLLRMEMDTRSKRRHKTRTRTNTIFICIHNHAGGLCVCMHARWWADRSGTV